MFRFVTMDDVRKQAKNLGVDISDLGNAAGSVFRPKALWKFTGEFRASEKVSRHANANRVWEYIGQ